MSTYNGEKYVAEQIQSILCQDDVDVQLLIRDDGSTDNTRAVIDKLAAEHSNISIVRGENVGFVKSFGELVHLALSCEADYYAFVDQDDIWMSNKLLTQCNALDAFDKDVPALSSCNSIYIDVNGNEQGLFHPIRPYYTKGNVIYIGTEQGCSMVFNRKCIELYDAYPPTITWHDRWMFLIAFFLGNVYYEHRPLFYYRIHGNNALGENKRPPKIFSKEWLKDKRDRWLSKKQKHQHAYMTEEFYNTFFEQLTIKDKKVIRHYLRYQDHLLDKLAFLFCPIYKTPYVHSFHKREQIFRQKLCNIV